MQVGVLVVMRVFSIPVFVSIVANTNSTVCDTIYDREWIRQNLKLLSHLISHDMKPIKPHSDRF